MKNLLSFIKPVLAKAHTTAATTNFASDWVDTQGFEGVAFRTRFGVGAATDSMALSGADSSTGLNTNTLAGTQVIATTANKAPLIELTNPPQRFIRADIVRTASQLVGDIWADLYNPAIRPPGVGSGITAEQHNDPSTGSI